MCERLILHARGWMVKDMYVRTAAQFFCFLKKACMQCSSFYTAVAITTGIGRLINLEFEDFFPDKGCKMQRFDIDNGILDIAIAS